MKSRMRKWLFLFLLPVMLLSGCGGKEKEKPVNVAITDDIVSLDVAGTKEMLSETVGRCIYSTLYGFDGQLNLVPLLAESEEQVSDLEWLFTIRRGVTFHDGTALKASDVVFSIKRAMSIELADQSLLIIDEIEAVDDYTVRIVTTEPVVNLPSYFVRVSTSVMSEQAMSDPDYDFNQPVGSGPFKVVKRTEGVEICLERFDDYFAEKAKSRYLNFIVEPSESNTTSSLLNGNIDVIYRVPANDADYLKLNEAVKIYQTDSTKTELLILNPRKEPLDDIRVRQAIACAIDKQNIIDNVLSGYGRLQSSMIPAPLIGFQDFDGYSYDPEQAKKLLTEAGYPDGLEFTVLTFDSQRKKLMEYIKLDLAKVNIKLDYEFLELSDYLEIVEQGVQQGSVMSWTSNADPDSMLTQLYSQAGHPTVNQTAYTDPQVEELLQQGRMESDMAKRDEIYREVNRIVAESYVSVPLYQSSTLVAARKEIGGIQVNPQGLFGYESIYRTAE